MPMNRRTFMTWVGVGWMASSLPVALAACSSQTTQTEASPNASSNLEFQTVGSVEELNKSSQLLKEKSPVGSVLVVRTTANDLSAVNPTCTHAGCVVQWQGAKKNFTCPCHGSVFDVDGKVLQGPAAKPLKTYQAKIEGNSVLVKEN